jgi:hypothetical protein
MCYLGKILLETTYKFSMQQRKGQHMSTDQYKPLMLCKLAPPQPPPPPPQEKNLLDKNM